MELSRSSNSSLNGRNRWEVAGWANWATTLIHEAWDDFIPSQSSVVSQLTSRGTWRHLVPVWMTVTVEGRGRDGSATTGGSSRTGEEASESWLHALTGDGKEAAGENIMFFVKCFVSWGGNIANICLLDQFTVGLSFSWDLLIRKSQKYDQTYPIKVSEKGSFFTFEIIQTLLVCLNVMKPTFTVRKWL